MGATYEDLEEMCDTLGNKVAEANEKIRGGHGELTGGDLTYIGDLTRALKAVKTIMAMMESEDHSYDAYPGNRSGNGYYQPYYGNSYARGRGARRDSMGRYVRGYSRGEDDAVEQLRDVMESITDERTKKDLEKIISRMEK